MVYDSAHIGKTAEVFHHAIVCDNAIVCGKVYGSALVCGEVYRTVKGFCMLGPDVIIDKGVDFDCDVQIFDKLELKSNDDFVFVRCGAGKFLYVKSEDRFFGDDNEEVKKIIRCLKL